MFLYWGGVQIFLCLGKTDYYLLPELVEGRVRVRLDSNTHRTVLACLVNIHIFFKVNQSFHRMLGCITTT